MLVDTHCHLDFNYFDNDRLNVIQRAREAGVNRLLNPGINLETSRIALVQANDHEWIYAACGVHPNEARSWVDTMLDELRTMASHPKVVALGEIGLDYYRDHSPPDLQRRIFRSQLDLAAELSLPVVIHNRAATPDVLEMLAQWQKELVSAGSPVANRPGVLHSFSGDLAAARQAIDLGFYIGITGPITFRNGEDLRQIVAELPIDRLLIETDAPFLTPHPHRGKRNEPAYVRYIAEKIAELHSLSMDEVARITTANARKLFLW